MRTIRTALLAAPVALFAALTLAASTAFAADTPTKFTFGPFQAMFETLRPYAMVVFLILGLYALIHNMGRSLTGTLQKPRGDGSMAIDHRASIGHLVELVFFIVVLEVLVYGVLYYGLDLFGAAINLLQQAATNPPAN